MTSGVLCIRGPNSQPYPMPNVKEIKTAVAKNWLTIVEIVLRSHLRRLLVFHVSSA